MNIAPLRKSIIKESSIFGVLIVIFAAAAFFLDGLHEDYLEKKRSAENSANKMLSEKRDVENRFIAVKEGMNDYKESEEHIKSPGLYIDSQALRDLFNGYQSRFYLRKSAVEMQPIVDLKDDPKYVRKNFLATKTNAKIIIETASDEDIYKLIRAMQQELPGFTRIVALSLGKKTDVTKEVVTEIRRTGTHSVISAEIMFDWYGLKSTNPDSTFNKYIPKKNEGKIQ